MGRLSGIPLQIPFQIDARRFDGILGSFLLFMLTLQMFEGFAAFSGLVSAELEKFSHAAFVSSFSWPVAFFFFLFVILVVVQICTFIC
jgi:hypothetical protein